MMHIDETSNDMLLKVLANRGIDVRTIREFSMTELNNEITRRRMEAERTAFTMAEIYVENANKENQE